MKCIWVYTVLIITLCAGCQRYIDWAKGNFYQGENARWYDPNITHCAVRSVTVYDQFDTLAMFNALWLCDEVRTAYADAYAFKRGKSVEQKNAFLRRQLEENCHFIVFYVLSSQNISLSGSEAVWAIMLEVNNNVYAPVEVKRIELCPEYKTIFDTHFNRFKVAYQVRFDAKDAEGNLLLCQGVQELILRLRSVQKEVALTWELA